jgi:glyoxylase-like metal-dependent hydrolase (beta-lactamase superfamily II)
LFGIVTFGMVYSATAAVWPSFYGEMFPTPVRLSGMAIGTQIGFAISGFAPTLATAIAGTGRDSWLGVAAITAIFCLVNVIAVVTGKETYRVRTEQLGRPVGHVVLTHLHYDHTGTARDFGNAKYVVQQRHSTTGPHPGPRPPGPPPLPHLTPNVAIIAD